MRNVLYYTQCKRITLNIYNVVACDFRSSLPLHTIQAKTNIYTLAVRQIRQGMAKLLIIYTIHEIWLMTSVP